MSGSKVAYGTNANLPRVPRCNVSQADAIASGMVSAISPLTPEPLAVNVGVPPPEAYYPHRNMRSDLYAIAPDRIRALPIDPTRGYPVPFFVPWIDGVPEFRTAASSARARCISDSLCWVCGQKLGTFKAFTIGPMCAINRVTAEPPEHTECAIFSVKGCPFLSKPQMDRRENDLPELRNEAPGMMIRRNPGVSLIWVTKTFKEFLAPGGKLISIGDPEDLTWWKEGRPATRAEVLFSVITGLPLLFGPDPSQAVKEAIASAYVKAEKLFPKE